MPVNMPDRRVQKTRRLLKDALVALIDEKGYEAVTIKDILDRANVGRSTFYLHYQDKQDLMHSCFDDFNKLFEQYSLGTPNSKRSGDPAEAGFMLNLFRFAEQNHRLLKALLGKNGNAMFDNAINDFIYNCFNGMLNTAHFNKNHTTLQAEMLNHYLTNAFVGIMKWWLGKDMPCSAEELNKYFSRTAVYDSAEVFGLGTPHPLA